MTMSEVEVDRITQRVFQAHNSGLNGALVKVVIDEIENALERVADHIEGAPAETWGVSLYVPDEPQAAYVAGVNAAIEFAARSIRTATRGES